MALLGTIRNRFGWVMMGLIFIGMLSFLFMDISPSAGAGGGGSQNVGFVNGEKVSNKLVQEYTQNFQGGQMLQEEISQTVWRVIVEEKMFDQKTAEAGFGVSADELGQLFLSPDPRRMSPIVSRQFGDNQGKVNTENIKTYIERFKNPGKLFANATTDEQRAEIREQQAAWLKLEQSVKKNSLKNKYLGAIQLGMYTPNWMVEMEDKTQNTAYNFDYVRIPYQNITDKVEVSDQEIKDYIKANPRQYKREATASIDYVTFDVTPTAKDSAMYRDELQVVYDDLAKKGDIKEDSNKVARYYGAFPVDYYTKNELALTQPAAIVDSIVDAEDGTVFGPYVHGNKFKVLKKVVTKSLPDSVNSRHILLRAQNPQEGQRAQVLIDSLLKVLKTDPTANFDTLAAKYSQDGSRLSGGKLGWKAKDGSFVAPFETYMFYTGKKDSFSVVYTEFGIHIIQITGYKYETDKVGSRIITVEKDIIPSQTTTSDKQREVIEFITENRKAADLKAAAKAAGYNVTSANGLEKGGYSILGIGKNNTAADIIRWAHDAETKVGEVTNRPYALENEELNCTEKFIVTALTARAPKGLATIDDTKVKGDIDRILRNEKKTAIVKEKLTKLTSLDAIAGEFGVIKETASSVQYGSAQIGVVGSEPKVAAMAAKTAAGQMSGAVGGKEGVYVLEVTTVVDAPAMADVKNARQTINNRAVQIIGGRQMETLIDAMKETIEIEDNRNSL